MKKLREIPSPAITPRCCASAAQVQETRISVSAFRNREEIKGALAQVGQGSRTARLCAAHTTHTPPRTTPNPAPTYLSTYRNSSSTIFYRGPQRGQPYIDSRVHVSYDPI